MVGALSLRVPWGAADGSPIVIGEWPLETGGFATRRWRRSDPKQTRGFPGVFGSLQASRRPRSALAEIPMPRPEYFCGSHPVPSGHLPALIGPPRPLLTLSTLSAIRDAPMPSFSGLGVSVPIADIPRFLQFALMGRWQKADCIAARVV